jgi:hypothetical protein
LLIFQQLSQLIVTEIQYIRKLKGLFLSLFYIKKSGFHLKAT